MAAPAAERPAGKVLLDLPDMAQAAHKPLQGLRPLHGEATSHPLRRWQRLAPWGTGSDLESPVQERFDHHCDVVGTCIAAGNQRFFIALLLVGQGAAALLLYGCVWRLQKLSSSGWDPA